RPPGQTCGPGPVGASIPARAVHPLPRRSDLLLSQHPRLYPFWTRKSIPSSIVFLSARRPLEWLVGHARRVVPGAHPAHRVSAVGRVPVTTASATANTGFTGFTGSRTPPCELSRYGAQANCT